MAGDKSSDGGLSVKRDLKECGWICACTLALGGFLACLFFNIFVLIRTVHLPKNMGIEPLQLLVISSLLVCVIGGGLVCAAVWYRVRRDLGWSLVCCSGGGSMGVVMGFFGICIFCVAPMTMDLAKERAAAAVQLEFDNYDVNNFQKMADEKNDFDDTQRKNHCCGIVGPGDWPHYHKIDPPPSCCGEDACVNGTGRFNKGCQFVLHEVIFVSKIIAGILGILAVLVVILWIFVHIKIIDYKHILTAEFDKEQENKEGTEIDVEHMKAD